MEEEAERERERQREIERERERERRSRRRRRNPAGGGAVRASTINAAYQAANQNIEAFVGGK